MTAKRKTKPVTARDGVCCSCGYEGKRETKCRARHDKTHCVHWWDGSDDAARNLPAKGNG